VLQFDFAPSQLPWRHDGGAAAAESKAGERGGGVAGGVGARAATGGGGRGVALCAQLREASLRAQDAAKTRGVRSVSDTR
jgi:hypothetical protein